MDSHVELGRNNATPALRGGAQQEPDEVRRVHRQPSRGIDGGQRRIEAPLHGVGDAGAHVVVEHYGAVLWCAAGVNVLQERGPRALSSGKAERMDLQLPPGHTANTSWLPLNRWLING